MFFHNKALQVKLNTFCEELDELSTHVARHTTPEMIAGEFQTGFKPSSIVTDDEYQRLRKESKRANTIASKAWVELENMVPDLRAMIT